MKRLLLLSLLASAEVFAATGNATLSFTRPTTYMDGTPLPVTDIAGYQVNCMFVNTGTTVRYPCTALAPLEIPGAGQTGSVSFTFPAQGGRACFSLRTRVGTAVSDPSSPEACRDFAPLAPGAPGGVTVTVTVTVGP